MIDEQQERRRFERVTSTVALQYKKLRNVSESTTGAVAQDVGEGGIRFIANEFLPLASRLVVEVFLPAIPKPVKAISKVAWIRKAPSNDQYIIGNQFLDIGREDKGHLAEYVKKVKTTATATY